MYAISHKVRAGRFNPFHHRELITTMLFWRSAALPESFQSLPSQGTHHNLASSTPTKRRGEVSIPSITGNSSQPRSVSGVPARRRSFNPFHHRELITTYLNVRKLYIRCCFNPFHHR